MFNSSTLNEKIEDGTLGIPTPELLWEGGTDLYYFWLGDDYLMDGMTSENLQQKTTLRKRVKATTECPQGEG